MRVWVTGATGFLGRNLVQFLVDKGYDVTVLYRNADKLSHLPQVKGVQGDILDPSSLEKCFRGADWVFHVAGEVAWGRNRRKRMFQTNIQGSENVARAACRAGVKRFIHTSSAAAIGFSTDSRPVDEAFPFNGDTLGIGYAIAKKRGEEAVLKQIPQGLPATVVNPGVIIGPGSPSFVSAVAQGRLKVAPSGGINVCDVKDVVAGHERAAKEGKVGERYILGGTDLPLTELFRKIRRVAGGSERIHTLPPFVARLLSSGAEWLARNRERDPFLPEDLARLTGRSVYYSSAKAERELGYRRTPLEQTLAHLKEQGYL